MFLVLCLSPFILWSRDVIANPVMSLSFSQSWYEVRYSKPFYLGCEELEYCSRIVGIWRGNQLGVERRGLQVEVNCCGRGGVEPEEGQVIHVSLGPNHRNSSYKQEFHFECHGQLISVKILGSLFNWIFMIWCPLPPLLIWFECRGIFTWSYGFLQLRNVIHLEISERINFKFLSVVRVSRLSYCASSFKHASDLRLKLRGYWKAEYDRHL